MNFWKKSKNMLVSIVMMILLTGCGTNHMSQEETEIEIEIETETKTEFETPFETEFETELSTQVQTDVTDNHNDADLIDKFLAGEVDAEANGAHAGTFNISQLPMDEEEWDSYRIGERIDLDNDGVEELILNGPYGGMYIDSFDGKVKVFAGGDGTTSNLSYVYRDNEVWIVHSDTMHYGRKYYKFEKYSGADNVVDSVVIEIHEPLENEGYKYYINGNEVSGSEYDELYQAFFGIDAEEEKGAEEAQTKNSDADEAEGYDHAYIGEYLDSDVGEPNLQIARGEDGKYIVQIGIYRLASFGDGVGEITAEGMNFVATDPAGNPISGVITIENEIANVTFTNSTWEYLANGSAFQYVKSSNSPNLWRE